MKILTIIAISGALSLGFAGFSAAQDQAPAADSSATQNPAVKSPNDMTMAPLAKGHNSFTKSEAASRIRSAGYSHVVVSALNNDGLWQATAMQNGQSVHVALDYKGNVASQ
jgi:hypothetical protein